MMNLLFIALVSALSLTAAQDNVTSSGKPDPVDIKPDKVMYSEKIGNATIFGATCNQTARGTGSYNGSTVKYNCLETGYIDSYNWAIACGVEKASKGAVVCQGFRNGGKLKAKNGLATGFVNCDDIVAGECSNLNGTTTCRYNCSENMCQAFHGIDFFEGNNLAFGNLFKNKTLGTVTITPKRLTVNNKGKAFKWRKVSVADLCFESNAITTCYQQERIVNYPEFDQCLNFRMNKHIQLGWISALDAKQIVKAADNGKLYKKIKPTKAPKPCKKHCPTPAPTKKPKKKKKSTTN